MSTVLVMRDSDLIVDSPVRAALSIPWKRLYGWWAMPEVGMRLSLVGQPWRLAVLPL